MQNDLFNPVNPETVRVEARLILGEWADYLTLETLHNLLENILPSVQDDEEHYRIFPEEQDRFAALRLVGKPSNVRVVILGQDPYHDGNANGIAFGCKHHITPSLKSILKCIERTTEYSRATAITGSGISLRYLAEQGVLLLNTALTVRANQPGSHSHDKDTYLTLDWHPFIKGILATSIEYSSLGSPIFLLWGGQARKYARHLQPRQGLTSVSVPILEAEHPVMGERENRDWNCDHFRLVNEYLASMNSPPIKWL